MRAIATRSILLACLLSPAVAIAQEKPATPPPAPASTTPPGHYRLIYRVLDVGADNKISKSRTYSTIASSEDSHGKATQIRNGDRVPIATGSNFAQYTYQDVGTNIDTFQPRIHEKELSLEVSADLTSAVREEGDDAKHPPVIRHISWTSNVIVPLGKPTIIFTSDNVSDSGKTELELTATPIREP